MTHRQHYENYRSAKLSGIAQESNFKTHDGQDPMMLMDAEKREHEQKLAKMKADMEAVFTQKVSFIMCMSYGGCTKVVRLSARRLSQNSHSFNCCYTIKCFRHLITLLTIPINLVKGEAKGDQVLRPGSPCVLSISFSTQ